MDYTEDVYEGLDLSTHELFAHTRKSPVELNLSDREGRLLFKVLLDFLDSEEKFLSLMSHAQKALKEFQDEKPESSMGPFITRYPCGYTISFAFHFIATLLGMQSPQAVFRDLFSFRSVRTHFVERKLRRLGFFYFLKKHYIAPRGAVGVLGPRSSNDRSGHIYFITKDGAQRADLGTDSGAEFGVDGPKWKIKDLCAENLYYFDYTHAPDGEHHTEGFWLPPGIYPYRRAFIGWETMIVRYLKNYKYFNQPRYCYELRNVYFDSNGVVTKIDNRISESETTIKALRRSLGNCFEKPIIDGETFLPIKDSDVV